MALRGLAVVVCLLAGGPACLAAPAPGISPDRAADAVRAIEGQPDLLVPPPVQAVDGLGRPVYRFRFSSIHHVAVDATSGAVVEAFLPGPRNYPARDKRLNEDEAVQIARTFCAAHYPDFMRRDLAVRCVASPHPDVTFQERAPGTRALTANMLSVSIDGSSHTVRQVSFVDMPIPQALRVAPAISLQQATAIAGQRLGVRIAGTTRSVLAAAPRFGPVCVWTLRLLCDPGDGLVYERTVTIDAQAGDVLEVNAPKGGGPIGASSNRCVLYARSGQPALVNLSLVPRTVKGRLLMPARFAELFGMARRQTGHGKVVFHQPDQGATGSEVGVSMLDGRQWVPADAVLEAVEKQEKGGVAAFQADATRSALLIQVADPAILERAVSWKIGARARPRELGPAMAPWHRPFASDQ